APSAGASESLSNALKTLEQRPQRTYPWPTRRSFAVTASVNVHLGQTVNMAAVAPRDSQSDAVERHPTVALCVALHIKPLIKRRRHFVSFLRQQPRQHEMRPRRQQRREGGGALLEDRRENIGHQHIAARRQVVGARIGAQAVG